MSLSPSPSQPLVVLRTRGSQAEMGEQHAKVLWEIGGWKGAAEFYPRMAARLLTMGLPARARPAAERVMIHALGRGSSRMLRYRRRTFPAYQARTDALLEVAGVPPAMARSFLVMDVFQGWIGMLARRDFFGVTGLKVGPAPGCSSLAVWGGASADGTLRHARNFDFPGMGVWDAAPAVVFCEPDEGLRYGFATMRGVDAPGPTAFNEAGITVTVNTRFHRDNRFDRASVIDMGHELIRRSRTLAEATEIMRGFESASTWGFVVSSAAEGRALLFETTSKEIAVVEAAPGAEHIVSTNRYQTASMQPGEVTTSPVFAVDSDSRARRLGMAVEAAAGRGLSAEDLQELLGDLVDLGACDGSPETRRLLGNCVMHPASVQSVVFEPEASRLRLSVGRAPTGFGPYVEVPWSWDGPAGLVETYDVATGPRAPRAVDGAPISGDELRAIETWVDAARLRFENAPPAEIRARLEDAVRLAPAEPHLRFGAAIAAVNEGDLETADVHLQRALELEAGAFRRGLLLLWKSRVDAAALRAVAAETARQELLALDHPGLGRYKEAAVRERARPKSPRALAAMLPDLFAIDA